MEARWRNPGGGGDGLWCLGGPENPGDRRMLGPLGWMLGPMGPKLGLVLGLRLAGAWILALFLGGSSWPNHKENARKKREARPR